jgi:hypothetical protein
MSWPVPCAYPYTVKRKPCKNRAVGEWFRCHRHNRKWQRSTDGHIVIHSLRRWQTIKDGEIVENRRASGPSLFRTRALHSTLLYHRGFARPPLDVVRTLPSWRQQMIALWKERRTEVQKLRPMHLIHVWEDRRSFERAGDLSPNLVRMLPAARTLLGSSAATLVSICLLPALPGNWSVIDRYLASIFFRVSWAVFKEGVWRAANAMNKSGSGVSVGLC